MNKFLGMFTLQYPINGCDSNVQLQKDQQLKMQSDHLQFEEMISQNGKSRIKLRPTNIISALYTEDDQYFIQVYHFYQEIWSFLINYNYISLSISVIDITQFNYVIQFNVYLLEKSFQQEERLKNDFNRDNLNQKDQKTVKQIQKLIDQYAKESFIILFEILNLTFSIKAPLRPIQQTKSLDQFLVDKFSKLEYYQRKTLFKNLLIPSILKNNQVNVTKQKLIQIEQQVNRDDIEYQSISKMEQEEQAKNFFSVNEQQSFEFTNCKQPEDLNRQLFDYQAQAVNWMLYREQRQTAQVLNLSDSNQTLNKMWSQIKLNENEYIYFNELTGQFSQNAIPQKEVKGGILADAMGLGKTICSLALILLSREMKQQQQQSNDDNQEPFKKKVKLEKKQANTLLVVELNIFEHWLQEIKSHTKLNKLEVYEFYKKESRSKNIKLEIYDIVITTYGVLKQDYNKNQLLYNYEWERIILDEAHVIKSKNTTSAKAASFIEAQCRWCLTGTPIQNNLEDLFSLFLFLKIETFSDFHWFNHYINKQQNQVIKFNLLHQIIKPILLRRNKETKQIQISLNLPNKQHFIISVKMSKNEQQFYNTLYSNTCQQIKEYFGIGLKQKPIKTKYVHVFQLLSLLRLSCDHIGIVARKLINKQIKLQEANKSKCEQMIKRFIENAQFSLEQSLKAAILQLQEKQEKVRQKNQEEEIEEEGDNFSIQDEFYENDSTNDENEQEQQMDEGLIEIELRNRIQQLEQVKQDKEDPQLNQKKYENFFEKVKNDDCTICREAFKKINQVYYLGCTHLYCSDCFEKYEGFKQKVSCPQCRREIDKNTKIKIGYQFSVQENIQQQEQQNKQSKENFISPKQDSYKESSKINEILKYVEYVQNRNEKVVIFTQWLSILNFIEGKLRIKGIQFRNIQGKMDKNQRKASINDFFEKNITVMLISLKAGAYGINLSCANHVLLVDPWWNPAIEDQAVERVHRLGQLKNVQILSFVCENTIEERVLQLHKIKRKLFQDALHLKLPDKEFKFQDQIELVMNQKLDS
ncbi:unnamed protein product [Paramecium sonneborni]|uniref:DNA repair protein RAD5 n=1 Tax=Paramecium sonneborni TaxID=65129 RepID=A0A8S1L0Q4_9CILI|nr:unnamed protein product [Paramecium sonneborni]